MEQTESIKQNAEKQPVLRLAGSWTTYAAIYHGVPQERLTPKQMGQLKLLKRDLGPGATLVIEWAIKNWQAFAKQARCNADLPCAPTKPHIGFLLAHYSPAFHAVCDLADKMDVKTKADSDFVSTVEEMKVYIEQLVKEIYGDEA